MSVDAGSGGFVQDIRSKNAGPFWITIDLFCTDAAAFSALCEALSTQAVADALCTTAERLQRFDIAALNVIKFSAPREVVQGARADRDMHGASYAVVIKELIDALERTELERKETESQLS